MFEMFGVFDFLIVALIVGGCGLVVYSRVKKAKK